MLVLSRKQAETIVVDGQITIEVLRVKGNTVKLGISAPKSVKVLRGELAPFGMADSADERMVADLENVVVSEIETESEPAAAPGESGRPQRDYVAETGTDYRTVSVAIRA